MGSLGPYGAVSLLISTKKIIDTVTNDAYDSSLILTSPQEGLIINVHVTNQRKLGKKDQ